MFICPSRFVRMGEAERWEPRESGGKGVGVGTGPRDSGPKGQVSGLWDLALILNGDEKPSGQERTDNREHDPGTGTVEHGAEGGGREIEGLPQSCLWPSQGDAVSIPKHRALPRAPESPAVLSQGKVGPTLNIISDLLHSGIKFISKSVQE